MPCRNKRRRRRESKNAGFHDDLTRCERARTRGKVEGSRPAWQEIGFVCEIPRAESAPRHLSLVLAGSPTLCPLPDRVGTCRGWFRSFQRKYYSRTRPYTLRPSIHRDLDRQLYSSQTAFNYRLRILSRWIRSLDDEDKGNVKGTKRDRDKAFV